MATKSNKDNLHKNHRKRMRQRFAINGFSDYHPHEVLEQILFQCIPRVNTNETAHRLIRRFGSLENVLRASPEELTQIEGIGPTSAKYVSGLLGRATDMIKAQYRSVDHLSVHQVAFLADWFMHAADPRNIGVITCDLDERFIDFRFLFEPQELSSFSQSVIDENFKIISDKLINTVEEGSYFIVMKDFVLERSVLYRLMDESRRCNRVMTNAYKLEGRRPISVIFPE